jgi:S1-C subfamily serine protease
MFVASPTLLALSAQSAFAQPLPATPSPPPVNAPETGAPPPTVVSTAHAGAEHPETDWLKTVYAQVADSVVRIQTELGTGSGFFFHSRRHIATALHVIDDADTIIVGTSDGRRQAARVVAYSRDYDLALLELESAVSEARVLEAYQGTVDVGDPVAIIGHPFSGLEITSARLRGLLNWTLTQGVVGAISGSWLQTDAAINPGNSGGPVLNARGQLLGVVSAKLSDAQGIGLAARVDRLTELVGRIGRDAPPRQTWRFEAIELGFMLHATAGNADTIDGFSLGTGFRLLRNYPVRLRIGYLAGDIEPETSTILTTRLARVTTELTFGYALALVESLELSPEVGAALFYDHKRNGSLQVDNTTCTNPPCIVEGKVLRSSGAELRFLPMAGLSLDWRFFRIGYAYQLDLRHLEDGNHRVQVAVKF